jgi:signal transduction histidine kinase
MHVEPEQMIDDAVRRVRAAGLRVAESVTEEVAGAPLVLRTTAARVVQEGVTNSLKHAGPGARVQVWVEVAGGVLSVLVADDGPPGMPPSLPPSGHGLAGLRERVALLGGTLIAGPAGAGWRLSARLPVREVT